MRTISQLARQFGLSRATLLYYEREGLLEPAARAANGYRYYGGREAERLRRITGYRAFGVSIADIRELLQRESDVEIERVLRRRFEQLGEEIDALRRQQQALVAILEHADLDRQQPLDQARWTAIMRAAGLSEEDMWNWHREFEAHAPQAHQEFLESLQIEPQEVKRIRAWSRG